MIGRSDRTRQRQSRQSGCSSSSRRCTKGLHDRASGGYNGSRGSGYGGLLQAVPRVECGDELRLVGRHLTVVPEAVLYKITHIVTLI